MRWEMAVTWLEGLLDAGGGPRLLRHTPDLLAMLLRLARATGSHPYYIYI